MNGLDLDFTIWHTSNELGRTEANALRRTAVLKEIIDSIKTDAAAALQLIKR